MGYLLLPHLSLYWSSPLNGYHVLYFPSHYLFHFLFPPSKTVVIAFCAVSLLYIQNRLTLLSQSIFYTKKFSFSSALFTKRFINFLVSHPGFSMIYPWSTFLNSRSNFPRVTLTIAFPVVYLLWHKRTFIPYLGSLLMYPTSKVFLFCVFYPFRSSSFIFKSLFKLHSLHFDHDFSCF